MREFLEILLVGAWGACVVFICVLNHELHKKDSSPDAEAVKHGAPLDGEES